MKIVINHSASGFRLSEQAVRRIRMFDPNVCLSFIERNHPLLVEAVERLGYAANGQGSNLQIVEIPNDVDWDIHCVDGYEFVYDVSRMWGM